MRQMNGVTHPWTLEFIHYSQSNSCYHAGDSSVSYAAGVLHQKAQWYSISTFFVHVPAFSCFFLVLENFFIRILEFPSLFGFHDFQVKFCISDIYLNVKLELKCWLELQYC